MKKILICYYSETHSTEEVCQSINNTLAPSFDVTMSKIDQVKDVKTYDTILIAAPIHGMRWHQTASDFVINHANILKQKEVIYVALASMAYMGRHFWQKKVFNALEKPSKIVKPIETAVFGGLVGEMPAFLSFLFGIPKNVKADQRDWDMIDAWQRNLIKKL